MSSIAFITANVGGYEAPRPHFFMDRNVDYYYFTDGDAAPKGQTLVKIDKSLFPEEMLGVQIARLIKANPFKYLLGSSLNYEYIIWADACFEQKKSIMPLFSKLGNGKIITMEHPERSCVYDEIRAVSDFKLQKDEDLNEHKEVLLNSNYPANNGLAATGIMIRKNCPEVIELCELWKKLLSNKLYRDQLFFDYACWILKLEYKKFAYRERSLFLYPHKHEKKRISYE